MKKLLCLLALVEGVSVAGSPAVDNPTATIAPADDVEVLFAADTVDLP
jgi:hypothetical protein